MNQLLTYLNLVLPEITPEGKYFTATIPGHDDTKLSAQRHNSLLDVATFITLKNKNPMNNNVFIGTGLYGKRRTQEQCLLKKVWYVDIDYHPTKPSAQYKTKAEAVPAIRAAALDGLPQWTFLVDSGHGFHLYWVLDRAVVPTKWEPLSHALRDACTKHGLKIDASVSSDSARILRVPTTYNVKDPKHPVLCEIKGKIREPHTYETFAAAFNSYLSGPVLATAPTHLPLNDDLSANLEQLSVPAENMMEECGIFKEALETGGAGASEELWRSILQVLAYASDGVDWIHKVSEGYEKYSEAATTRKYNHAVANKGSVGPIKCSSFSNMSPHCATCVHKGTIKTPLYAAPLVLPDPAPKYFPSKLFRNYKGVLQQYDSEDGWSTACRYTVTNLDRYVNEAGDVTIGFKVDKYHIESLAKDLLGDDRKLRRILSNKGFGLSTYEFKGVYALMCAWLANLRKAKVAPQRLLPQYGWTDEGGFHYNGYVHNPDGTSSPVPVLDDTIARMYSTRGTLDAWRTMANEVLKPNREAAWCAIAASFGSPLIGFTGVSGAVLAIVSPETGTGKSTALRVAQTVWGDVKGMASLHDTQNAVANKLGVLKNLPGFWDEVRGEKVVADVVSLVFSLSQGREKARLDTNITQRASGTWSTILVIASNTSIKECADDAIGQSDAGSARCVEITMHPFTKGAPDSYVREIYDGVNDNYGCAGLVYAQWLSTHRDEAKTTVKRFDAFLCDKMQSKPSERFWVTSMASMLAGAHIATKLGLCTFDMKAFITYLCKVFLEHRALAVEDKGTVTRSPLEAIRAYIIASTEQTVTESHQKTRAGKVTITAIDSDRKPTVMRINSSTGDIAIAIAPFRDWYKSTYHVSGKAMVTSVRRKLGMASKDAYPREFLDQYTVNVSGRGPRQTCFTVPTTTGYFKDVGDFKI